MLLVQLIVYIFWVETFFYLLTHSYPGALLNKIIFCLSIQSPSSSSISTSVLHEFFPRASADDIHAALEQSNGDTDAAISARLEGYNYNHYHV